MSKTVKYVGTAGIREVTAADFKRAGFDGQKAIKVAGPNLNNPAVAKRTDKTAEVSDEVAEWLVENEDFEVVESGDDDEEEDAASAATTSTDDAVTPEPSPDAGAGNPGATPVPTPPTTAPRKSAGRRT